MLRFSDQIHTAYLDAVHAGKLDGAPALLEMLGDFNARPELHDLAWTALLNGYKNGPREAWAIAVLEAMRVDLVVAIASMPALPPIIGHDDIAQALIVETLAAASDGPTYPARWTRHRLITRATTAVERSLADEVRRLSGQASPAAPQPESDGEAARSLREVLVDVEAGRLPARAVTLLYRQEVLGESLREIAADLGVSADAIRKRRDRSVDEIRRRLAA